jgi:hypothetical protein
MVFNTVLLTDKMFKYFLIFFLCINAYSTERPLILKKLMEKNEPENNTITIKVLTEDEKIFFWKDTKLDSDGTLLVASKFNKKLDLIDRMYANSTKAIQRSTILFNQLSKKIDLVEFVGELQESENRINYFISVPTGIAMITISDFVADGAKITLISDFLNVKVNEHPATLTIVMGDALLAKRVWKLTWINKNIQYELQIPDEIQTNGVLKLTKADIISFATKITNL